MVIKFVRCVLLDVILLTYIVAAVSSSGSDFNTVKRFPSISNLHGTCTVKSSGGDDGPALTAAILSDHCSTVNIPAGTTINIASPLNTTATYNKHISLAGTLSFTNDTVGPYLTDHAFANTELYCVRPTGNNIRSSLLTKTPQYAPFICRDKLRLKKLY